MTSAGRRSSLVEEFGACNFRILVDPIVRSRARLLLVFVHVNFEALAIALVLPVGDGVAETVEERAATEVQPADEHAAEMTDVADTVPARAECGEEFDRAHHSDIRAHGNGHGKGYQPYAAVGKKNGVGNEDAENRAGGADGRAVGGRM